MPIGVIERLACRTHRENDEIVDLALVFWLHPFIGIKSAAAAITSRNQAGNPAGQIGDVKRVDLPGAALAVEDAFPRRLNAASARRHHAEARYGSPPHVQQPRPVLE